MALGGNTVVRVRAPLVNDVVDNTAYRDWGNASLLTVTGCMIQPFQLSSKLQIEMNIDREFSAAFFRIWMPAGTDIKPTDRLRVAGLELDVYGVPGPWFDLNGLPSHLSVLTYVREG